MYGFEPHETSEEHHLKEYKKFLLHGTIRFARVGAVLSLFLPPIFLFVDLSIIEVTPILIGSRILPTVIGIIVGIGTLLKLKSKVAFINCLYYIFLLSLMTMMCIVILNYLGTPYIDDVFFGWIIVILAIFIGSRGGIKYIAPIYILPLIATILFLVYKGSMTKDIMVKFSNPMGISFICLIMAETYMRFRFREFKSTKIIENHNKQLMDDFELAQHVQQSLIPQTPTNISQIAFHTIYKPMYQIGGDFFDFIHFKEQSKIGIFICDVTGHGISAALIATMVKAFIDSSGQRGMNPGSLLHYINDRIQKTPNKFLSALYCIYDLNTGILSYARGGHHFPIIVRNDSSIVTLKSDGILIGLDNEPEFEVREFHCKKGDKLFLYTDGLTELVDSRQIQFDTVLEDVIKQHYKKDVNKFINAIYDEFRSFNTTISLHDDVCLIGMEIF